MEQSSVEFLLEKITLKKLDNEIYLKPTLTKEDIEEVNKMFEKQIIDSFNQDLYGGLNGNKKFDDGKQYFNQTFRKT